MGMIGKPVEIIEVLPAEQPAPEPVPVTPEREPVPA